MEAKKCKVYTYIYKGVYIYEDFFIVVKFRLNCG